MKILNFLNVKLVLLIVSVSVAHSTFAEAECYSYDPKGAMLQGRVVKRIVSDRPPATRKNAADFFLILKSPICIRKGVKDFNPHSTKDLDDIREIQLYLHTDNEDEVFVPLVDAEVTVHGTITVESPPYFMSGVVINISSIEKVASQ